VKAKVYLGIACCDPHTRETLHRAFDDAWVHIEPQVRPRRRDIEASRFKVAEIVLRLAKNGCRDPSAILGSTPATARLIAKGSLTSRS
jgi:hypothetical protein